MAATNDTISAVDREQLFDDKATEFEKPQDGTTRDAVFGEITEEGPNYRAVSFVRHRAVRLVAKLF